MSVGTTAYLVVRRDDGFGDVFPLDRRHSVHLGRAATNRIVLKDDLCSREHAEVCFADGRWRVRDLGSLNGTRVNGERLDGEWELAPSDEVHLGRTPLAVRRGHGPAARPAAGRRADAGRRRRSRSASARRAS